MAKGKAYYMPVEPQTEEEKKVAQESYDASVQEKAERLKQLSEDKEEKQKAINFMTEKFAPFEDRILVYPDPVEEKTAGGLYKPDAAIDKVKPMIGTVVAVGPGKANSTYMRTQNNKYDSVTTSEFPVHKGMRISYGNYAGTEFIIDDVKYLIMRFADCFGEVK
ncbi:MAG TPA: co-chaperone GroES [Cyclobacteriaceae bacterium]|jgi:chaperonin GroES|nr:co-chaperone GroES [Cyclobacteriaceae bacterium]